MGKNKHEEHENHERWLVSYADMMTLLFALFVVLYALKNTDSTDEVTGQVAAASAEVFSQSLEDIPIDKRQAPEAGGFGVFEDLAGTAETNKEMRRFPDKSRKEMVIDDEVEKLKEMIESATPGEIMSVKSASMGSSRVVSVNKTAEGITVRLMASAFYKPSQYELNADSRKKLDAIAPELKELGRFVSVEGHTDNIEPSGKLDNWALSSLRASYIVRYFVDKHNFPVTLISASGWGDSKPIAHNGTKSGRQLNRRIEIKIKYDDY